MSNLIARAGALSNANRLQILEWLKEPARHFGPEHPVDPDEGVCVKPPRKPEPLGGREFPQTESLHEEIQIQ